MKVVDRDGRTWRVTRRWTPWRWQARRLGGGNGNLGGMDLDVTDPVGAILWFFVAALIVPVVAVALVAGLEALLLLLLIPVGLLGRVAFGRRWKVEARLGFTPWWEEEEVGDWRASAERIREVAAAIERGDLPEPALDPWG